MTTISFGKYKGLPIQDVPEDYLLWLISNSEGTIAMCKREIERRTLAEDASMPWIDRIIKSGYRELSKKHHPDLGGDSTDMKELNAAYEALKEARR